MSFVEKVQILIETSTEKAVAGLTSFKTSMAEAEGFSGKLKAGVGGLGDVFSSAAKNPAVMGTAIGAAALFAEKAVSHFSEAGVAVGNFSTATGTSAEQASRWVEVAKNLGVGADSVQTAMGKMEKQLGKNVDAFKEFGVSAILAKDGTVDANATFLTAIDHLKAMEDPVKRAEAGAKMFGKGWQSMSALIGEGSDKLRADLAAVAPSNIFKDGDVESAKKVRDAFAEIKNAGEGLMLTIGKALAPVITELAPVFAKLITAIAPVAEVIGKGLAVQIKMVTPLLNAMIPVINTLAKAAEYLSKAFDKLFGPNDIEKLVGSINAVTKAGREAGLSTQELKDILKESSGVDDFKARVDSLAASHVAHADTIKSDYEASAKYYSQLDTAKEVAAEAKKAHDALQESLKLEAEIQKSATDEMKRHSDALKADLAAELALEAAMRSAADASFNVADKTQAYRASLEALGKKLKDAKGDQDLIDQAYRDNTRSAAALADAQVHLREETDKSNGTTTSAITKQDTWNQAMIAAAGTANGPARQAIVDYIDAANKIPAEKATIIKAAADAGDWAYVNAVINDTSRARTAAITAGLDQQSLAAVDRQIRDVLAVGYVAGVSVVGGRAPGIKGATGGIVTQPTYALIGEAGPEAVVPLNQTPGSSPLPTGGGSSGGGTTTNNYSITISGGLASSAEIGRVAVDAIKSYERSNGRVFSN